MLYLAVKARLQEYQIYTDNLMWCVAANVFYENRSRGEDAAVPLVVVCKREAFKEGTGLVVTDDDFGRSASDFEDIFSNGSFRPPLESGKVRITALDSTT